MKVADIVINSAILHITPKIFYRLGGMIPEKWAYRANKCKLENEGGLNSNEQKRENSS